MRTVVIEGVRIPEALIAQEAQNHPGVDGAQAWAAAGHALAVKALLLDRARVLGLTPEAQTDALGREETVEEALVRAVLDREIVVEPPGDAACRRVYDANPERFRSPMRYEAAHILFAWVDDTPEADAAARAQAQAALVEIAGDPARFAPIAQAASACPSGRLGGALGQLGEGDLVGEVERALLRLSPGETAPCPVRSRFGWHVVKLLRREAGRIVPFEAVKETIRLNLEGRAWTTEAVRYVAGLAHAARRAGAPVGLAAQGELLAPAPTLGSLVAGADLDRLERWLEVADAALLDRALAAATADGLSLPEFARIACAQFIETADDQAWTQLISAAQGAADPALTGLAAILKARVAPAKRTFTLIRRAAR